MKITEQKKVNENDTYTTTEIKKLEFSTCELERYSPGQK